MTPMGTVTPPVIETGSSGMALGIIFVKNHEIGMRNYVVCGGSVDSVKMVQYGQYLTSGDVWRLKTTVRCAVTTPVDDIPMSGMALGVIFEKNHENWMRNATPKFPICTLQVHYIGILG